MGEVIKVKFTVKASPDAEESSFLLEVHNDWAPLGAKRFMDLVSCNYFDQCRFHRVVSGFMVQFGLAADPGQYAEWGTKPIKDDPVAQSNTRGRVSFAMRGPDTRSCQLFINYGDNASLDEQGFSPLGEVTQGMDVVDTFYAGYGDYPPRGSGPEPEKIKAEGLEYLKGFPKLSCIVRTEVIP
uniref:Peptidyl-prolyl cis-trans isomerase n=1 Tax=Alexandrium andersonii TaxID=327968 RepID=A0A7S2INF4_9DINO